MGVDDSVAPVELLKDRVEGGVTKPLVAIAREQGDTVRLQGIEGVLEFAQAGVYIRKGQRHKYPETAPMVRREARGILVAFVAKPDRHRSVAEGISCRRNGRN